MRELPSLQTALRAATVLALTLAVPALALAQAATTPKAESPCEVSISPATVPIGADPVQLEAKLPEPLAGEVTASAPAASGITIDSIARAPDPSTIHLVLNTAKAVAGEWTVELKVAGTQCAASVKIAEP